MDVCLRNDAQGIEPHRPMSSPSLPYVDDVFFYQGWPYVVEGPGSLRKRQQAIELSANVTRDSHGFIIDEDFLQQRLCDLNLSICEYLSHM